MRRFVSAALAATFVMMGGVGCAANSQGQVSSKAATDLAAFVSAVRDAASHKSIANLTNKVHDLKAEVASLQDSGEISSQRAQKIENAATALLSDFTARNTPTTPPTSTSPSPTESDTPTPTATATVTVTPTITESETGSADPSDTATSGSGNGNGNGKGNGNGNGKGKGNDAG